MRHIQNPPKATGGRPFSGCLPADDDSAAYGAVARLRAATFALTTKMSFKRRVFQFPLDFGQEHSGRSFSGDLFDDHSIDSNDMFSEETPPGRWDPADMPRFHVVRNLRNDPCVQLPLRYSLCIHGLQLFQFISFLWLVDMLLCFVAIGVISVHEWMLLWRWELTFENFFLYYFFLKLYLLLIHSTGFEFEKCNCL